MDKEELEQNADELLEDLEDEGIEEEVDLVNAEVKSVDSVRKAAASGPKAKRRKGDKDGGEKKAFKTDKGIVRELYNKLSSMKREDVQAIYDVLMDEDFSTEDLSKDVLEDVEYDWNEDLKDLIESEATLSEAFKEKSAVIMETAIKSKLNEEIARLEEAYEEQLNEEVQSIKEDLIENIDGYLNHVVEEWIEENKLAVETGLRTEIAEGFMNSLKDLFVESYIQVPEEKVDLVDELANKVEELEEELNGNVEKIITMAEELEEFKRSAIILEAAADLTDTQLDKLTKLTEGIEFTDEETFAEKVNIIKESYFKTKNVRDETITEEAEEDYNTVEVDSKMDAYLKTLRRL